MVYKDMRAGRVILLLAASAAMAAVARADYRIQVKGGGTYWSAKKPVLKGNSYTFRNAEGTLMLLKKPDVLSITESAPPKTQTEAQDIGWSSPAEAAKAGKQMAARPVRKPPSDLEKSDAYRPGRGVAAPVTPDQYQVGRSLAPPASGEVLTGPPPKSETPPPPPPK